MHYNYKENIGALYFIVSKPVGRFNSQLGARLELSDNYATTDIIVQNNRQWNIFPSLNLNYNIAKNWDTNLSYATKISRPTFQDLNPAIDYNDLLAWDIEQDPNNSAISKVTQKNIDKSDVISVDLTLPYQNKWVSCYLSTGLIFTISNDAASGVNNLNQPMWYAYSGFDFSLPYGFKANVNIRYFTKGIENVFYFDPVFRMDIGIRKSFIKDKITATILWNDIFKTDNMNTYTTINNRYIGYNYYFDLSAVSLSISYRFSAQKSKYQSRSSIGAESQRIKNLN